MNKKENTATSESADESQIRNDLTTDTPNSAPKDVDITEDTKFTTPMAVVVAGVIIAGAIMFSGGGGSNQVARNADVNEPQANEVQPSVNEQEALENINPVTADDYVKGNLDAKVVIVEYSDAECPFCKRFHETMNQVVDEYDDSEVAWVYRHFPLEQLHPVKARKTALATECAADQGGTEAFWAFTDRFYELTPSNNQTDTDTVLPQIAGEIGLNVNEFNDCVATEKFADAVDADIQNAVETGGQGTPWSIMIGPDGTKTPLGGALPYESLKPMIDQMLES